MNLDLAEIKQFQKHLLEEDKKRLGLTPRPEAEDQDAVAEAPECRVREVPSGRRGEVDGGLSKQNVDVVRGLDLSCGDGALDDGGKRSFVDRLVNSENPLTFRSDDSSKCAMLRWGEYSPNNPQLRVATAPYLGLGEYEQRKLLLQRERQADYKQHLNNRNESIKKKSISEGKAVATGQSRSVQTDIQDINNQLVFGDCESSQASKECSPDSGSSDKENVYVRGNVDVQRIDQRLTSDQILQLSGADMDKPRSILSNRRTQTPTDHLLSGYSHGYGSSCLDGFSYQDRLDSVQRERLKREAYQQELRKQIEEKRQLTELRQEQERIEQERENRRLEQQLIRMQEEQMREDQLRAIRDEQSRWASAAADDVLRRQTYRKRYESESSPLSLRNAASIVPKLSHYSPPISRRSYNYSYTLPSASATTTAACSSSSYPGATPRYGTLPSRYESLLARRDALNRGATAYTPEPPLTSDYGFGRFDSLSRIDTLRNQDVCGGVRSEPFDLRTQRRHSATHQDLSAIRRSPKMQRRGSSGRLDANDPLPAPVLPARSPVARELKNSVAVNSAAGRPDFFRRYDDKWQKSLGGDSFSEAHNRNILTQLGTIRMQLQKEQLRMDESLRQRSSQSKAVNFH